MFPSSIVLVVQSGAGSSVRVYIFCITLKNIVAKPVMSLQEGFNPLGHEVGHQQPVILACFMSDHDSFGECLGESSTTSWNHRGVLI